MNFVKSFKKIVNKKSILTFYNHISPPLRQLVSMLLFYLVRPKYIRVARMKQAIRGKEIEANFGFADKLKIFKLANAT